ncbi:MULTISPECIES: hypothetical protein [Actinoplanes]|uniref:hypothetical protein n=1 Tax=Actinoplanes TaxID=1865 RepID=UPI0005F2A2B2|nr:MULTISPECIES: hypothetical protein [Actinoplanes]GLY02056.1 hypothetical protein Acsp01_24350 [Actinoplanes sp. NBRC 101535]
MISTWADILAATGPDPERFSAENAQYLVGPDAGVVVIAPGDRPQGSGVRTADRIVLRDLPAPVATLLDRGPLLGFVRVFDGYLSLGRLHLADGTFDKSGQLATAGLRVEERLSYEVLDRARPLAEVDLPGVAWLDRLPADPVAALRAFVTGWYGTPRLAGAATEGLPPALAAFHEIAADRPEMLGRLQTLIEAHRYRTWIGGLTVIGRENQGAWTILTDLAQPDPPVWYDGLASLRRARAQAAGRPEPEPREEDPLREREPLSGFLLQFVLSTAALESPFGAWADVDVEQAERFHATLQPVPLEPARIPADDTVHHAAPGLIVATGGEGDRRRIHVGASRRWALRDLRDPGFRWSRFDG